MTNKYTIPDDLSIPEFLRREDTTESKANRERLIKQLRRGSFRRVEKNSQSTISTGYAIPTTETGRAILKEVLKSNVSELQKDRARRALRKTRGDKVTQVGSKEMALREQRSNGQQSLTTLASQIAKPANGSAQPAAVGTVPVAAATKESTVANTATAKKATPVKTVVRKSAPRPAARSTARMAVVGTRADGLKEGSKLAVLIDSAVAAGAKGSTWEALAKKVGWRRVNWTLKDLCKKLHAKLTETDDGRVIVTLKK